jgi:hypothetical protein
MRTTLCVGAGWLVGALGASILVAGAAGAQQVTTNTQRPGSLLIFPKVTCSGNRDTVIQVANTGNMPDTAHCFYLNGASGRNGRPVCTTTDFFINLTKQQPTHWHVCTGRSVQPDPMRTDGAGLDPGLIPAVPDGFTGALLCAETDEEGIPIVANALKGEATIEGSGADVSKYNGIAIQGSSANASGDQTLSLNDSEYASCPSSARLNFIPEGRTDPVIEALGNGGRCSTSTDVGCNNSNECPPGESCVTGQSFVVSNLTVLPCKLDIENGIPSNLTLQLAGFDEFEVPFSGATTISCWGSFNVAPPTIGAVSTQYATVTVTSPAGQPFLAVGSQFEVDAVGNVASSALNLHVQGADTSGQIRLY